MRIRFLGGLLVAGLLLVPVAASPAFAVDGEFLVDLYGDTSAVYGSSMKVLECWDGQPGTTYLLVKKSGGWTRVASAEARKSKFCTGDYLATYTWKVNVLPKKNANGNRWLSVAVSGTPYFSKWTYPEKVQVMTRAEWNAENPDESTTPEPTVAPTTNPTPAPSPTPTPATPSAAPSPSSTGTPIDMAYFDHLWDRAKQAPDRQARRCLSLSNPLFDTDSRDFYDLGAWTGQQLFKLQYDVARVTTRLAYGLYCEAAFGINVRSL